MWRPMRALNRRRHRYQLFYRRAQQIEVAHIPRIEVIRACLECARRDQSVIDGATHNSQLRHAADGSAVLIAVKPNHGKPKLDSLHH